MHLVWYCLPYAYLSVQCAQCVLHTSQLVLYCLVKFALCTSHFPLWECKLEDTCISVKAKAGSKHWGGDNLINFFHLIRIFIIIYLDFPFICANVVEGGKQLLIAADAFFLKMCWSNENKRKGGSDCKIELHPNDLYLTFTGKAILLPELSKCVSFS